MMHFAAFAAFAPFAAFAGWALEYLLNAAWQVPLLFAAAWLATWVVRRSGAAVTHRIWVAALFLEALLPACSVHPGAWLFARTTWSWPAGRAALHGATVTVVTGAGQVHSGLHLAPFWQPVAAVLFAGSAFYFAARLGVALYSTAALRRRAAPIELHREARCSFDRLVHFFHLQRRAERIQVAVAGQVCGPVLLGIRRPMLVLPAGMQTETSQEDFEAALAHEFAHIQRHDFARNLLYQALTLPVAFHPLLWVTRTRVAESREALCDAMAADALHGRQRYARSLLRLAAIFSERTRSIPTHAIGMFDANSFSNFERRVTNLTNTRMQIKGIRLAGTAAAAGLVVFGACTSALALRMQVVAPAKLQTAKLQTAMLQTASTQAQQVAGSPVTVAVPRSATGTPAPSFVADISANTPARILVVSPTVAENPQAAHTAPGALPVSGSVMAGNVLSKVTPVYPQEAKDKQIQGTVMLFAVIGTNGSIKSLKLLSGPDELTKSAWDAVKQWTYKPYLLNGQPTEVETTITVNYTLAS